jgi:DNA-binding NarL/FixJ family response regulator
MRETAENFSIPHVHAGTPSGPLRVVIAEGQGLVRAGFRALLECQRDVVVAADAANSDQAVVATRATRPDVVVVDVDLPGDGGLETTRQILEHAADGAVRVVMLMTSDSDEAVFGALRAGATGLLLKDAEPEQLVSAVRAVACGEALLAPSLARRIVDEFLARPPVRCATPQQLEELTAREREVMTLVACGLSNEEIATRLVVTHATAKTHVSRVLCKLHLRDRAQLVVLAYEIGLVRPGTYEVPAAPARATVTRIGRARSARRRPGLQPVAA